MIYDTLGNLVADSSRPIYLQTYDYRNLLDYSRVERTLQTGPNPYLQFIYDENGQRIQKEYNYYYLDDCGPDTGIGTLGMETMGSGGGGGGDQCAFPTRTQLNYLYDNGVLVATFDHNGNSVNLYVNSGSERLAQYELNDDDKLYYHLKDHLGSPRVILSDPIDTSLTPVVRHVYAYYPFGELLQSWGGNESIHQFTGHEKDEHSSFDYLYFGARYYDARHGLFTSLDKAGQFSNGYVYGANNPIMGVDPDGNWFWALALVVAEGAATSGGIYTASYLADGIVKGQWGHGFLEGFATSAGMGALGAGIGFGIDKAWKVKSPGMAAVRGGAKSLVSTTLGNALSGRDFQSGVGFSVAFGVMAGVDTWDPTKNGSSGGETSSIEGFYKNKKTGDIKYFRPGANPGPEWEWTDFELFDPLGNPIPKDPNVIIPNATSEVELYKEAWKSTADKMGLKTMKAHLPIIHGSMFAGISISNHPAVGLDFKAMNHLTIGRHHRALSVVNNVVAENQYHGNHLWARIGREWGYSLGELRLGAGLAQIFQGTSRWSYYNSFFDDPVDQTAIING